MMILSAEDWERLGLDRVTAHELAKKLARGREEDIAKHGLEHVLMMDAFKARCGEILDYGSAHGCRELAVEFAFNSEMSAENAIALMSPGTGNTTRN